MRRGPSLSSCPRPHAIADVLWRGLEPLGAEEVHEVIVAKEIAEGRMDEAVRCDGAFEAIIDPAQFYTVQGIMLERHRRLSNDELLERLRQLHQKVGRLSGILISESEGMPSPAVYRHRFGSLIRAYELIGYTPDRDYAFVEISACAPPTARRSPAR
jgi:hypothetical protein